ncbi:hypothetical protein ColTof4_09331 [Colletotrichum tofieldiae]|nr:hypothetical protein ColTof3_12617 [Colletotrichum tofieldiae]GKT76908.1 hypothetical protein ColTof4_09331 [Colletotrichum tofieldiae]GKT92646.1 hypothetical protein Ct61P_10496 [Colletotrichum tofieldiae]
MVRCLWCNPLGDKGTEYVVWVQGMKLSAFPQTDKGFRSIQKVDVPVLKVLEKPLPHPARSGILAWDFGFEYLQVETRFVH